MAVAQALPQPATELASAERTAAFLTFFGALCVIPSVRRIGMLPTSSILDLWVQVSVDNEEDEARIYEAHRQMDATRRGPLVDLHVIFAWERPEAYPRTAIVVFERL